MKPHKANKSKKAATTAARSYLRAKLGWLRGFPLDAAEKGCLEWMSLRPLGGRADGTHINIDRERIRRTEFGRNAALRRFPNALPRVVGDVDRWKRRTDLQLEILKAAVHDHTPMPGLSDLLAASVSRRSVRDQAHEIAAHGPAFKRLCTAAVWVYWSSETDLRTALDLMHQYRSELSVLLQHLVGAAGTRCALQCLQLIADGCPPAFLRLLADPRCWEVPVSHGDFTRRMRKRLSDMSSGKSRRPQPQTQGFERPYPELGGALTEFISELSGRSRKIRRRQLELLDALIPDAQLQSWDAWWETATQLEREAMGLLSQVKPGRDARAKCSALAERINDELGAPGTFHWRDLFRTIETVSSTTTAAAHRELLACLNSATGSHHSRPLAQILLENWARELANPKRGWGVVTRLLSAQARLLEDAADLDAAAKLWLCDRLPDDLIDAWIYEPTPQNRIKPALEAVSTLLRNAPEIHGNWGPFKDYTGWDTLVAATAQTSDADLIVRLFELSPPHADGLSGKEWSTLVRLSGCDPETFEELVQSWKPRGWNALLLAELARLIAEPEAAGLLLAALRNGEAKRVRHLLAHTILAEFLREAPLDAPPPGKGTTIDVTPYPADLHDLLHELAERDTNAEHAADQILSSDFPRPSHLEAELAFLRARIEAGSEDQNLEMRIAAIERRLQARPGVSPMRLQNLRSKLQRRLDHARLLAWEEVLAGRVRSGLLHRLGTPPDDSWFAREQTVRVLAGLKGLSSGTADLAFRLISVRCGPQPWDLRADPENRRFLEKMRTRSVCVEPWLEGIGPRNFEIAGETLVFDLEPDPLEIFRMGELFQTCLSPGDFCFYSTIANAADVNKRVLYARDRKGTVQARCLLALTDIGHILTFHVYANDHREAMQAAVGSFVLELSEAMGAAVDTRGRVSTLVSKDWLDDGPHDLLGTMQWLEHGSQFRRSLPKIDPDALVPALEMELNGKPITAAVVCELCADPAFEDRPQLVEPLLPHLHDIATMDPWSSLHILPVVRKAGKEAEALDLLERIYPLLLHDDFRYSYAPVMAAREWVVLDQPHRALRLLRQTRPADVRGWEDEWVERTCVAAMALTGLHRPRQALTLCRIARRAGAKEVIALERELENWLEAESDS